MTYQRLFKDTKISDEWLNSFRTENYTEIGDDRMRCKNCHGFYWRLWADMAQCLSCQNYSIIEVGSPEGYNQLEFNFVDRRNNNLVAVAWVREQLLSKNGVEINRRITDPVSGRSEFIILKDRIRCRITGTETLISPEITGYWIIHTVPKLEGKTISNEEALKIVRESKSNNNREAKENDSSGDRAVIPSKIVRGEQAR